MTENRRKTPKVAPIPCPEPGCGGKLTLGFVAEAWRERQQQAGRTPDTYAYYCSNRRSGCRSYLRAHEDGSPRGMPVTAETKKLRDECHVAFDLIWRSAGALPKFRQQFNRGRESDNQVKHRRSITTKFRRIAYFYMADHLRIPEPEAHLSVMTDPDLLRRFKELALRTTAKDVDEWWDYIGNANYWADLRDIKRAARKCRFNKEPSK